MAIKMNILGTRMVPKEMSHSLQLRLDEKFVEKGMHRWMDAMKKKLEEMGIPFFSIGTDKTPTQALEYFPEGTRVDLLTCFVPRVDPCVAVETGRLALREGVNTVLVLSYYPIRDKADWIDNMKILPRYAKKTPDSNICLPSDEMIGSKLQFHELTGFSEKDFTPLIDSVMENQI